MAEDRYDHVLVGGSGTLGSRLDDLGKSSSPLKKNRAGGLRHKMRGGEMVFGGVLSLPQLVFRPGALPSCDIP